MVNSTPVEVQPGTMVIVRDALGNEHRMQAMTGVESKGHDFPVVWVASPATGHRIPWPADALRPE